VEIFPSPTEVSCIALPSRLRYLLRQGHTGDAREDAHMAIVTLKGMIWETKARRSEALVRKMSDFSGCVSSGGEVSQRVMAKRRFG